MSQNRISQLVTAAVNASGLQQPVTLSTGGNLTLVGNPGGPLVFARLGAYLLPGLGNGYPRGVTGVPPKP